jgi:hypothetical protein
MTSQYRLSVLAAMATGAMLTAGQGFARTPASGEAPQAKAKAEASTFPVRSCESLVGLALPHTTINSAAVVAATTSDPEYCEVQLTATSQSSSAGIKVGVFLPSGWNRRFVGFGGGGYTVGNPTEPCSEPPPFRYDTCALKHGFATAATDGGVAGPGTFALNPDGTLNWAAIENFGHHGIHQMTVTAKLVMAAYYGSGPKFSYFVGESTGGRQAIMEAQRYPDDYDGIVAGSPAINWTKFIPAEMWPQVVMNLAGHHIAQSTFQAVNDAVLAACDGLDGLKDGIISAWQACRFDAKSLVGDVLTAQEAEIVNKIWEGPRSPDGTFLYYGLTRGTPFGGIAGPSPFSISTRWFTHWLVQDPSFDWRSLTVETFQRYFEQSVSQYADALATDDPDLSAFRDAGGKLIIWHGTVDEVIMPDGVLNYYNRVVDKMGGMNETKKFVRLFMLPGIGHGSPLGGMIDAGYRSFSPVPGGMWQGIVDWVEQNKAPREFLGVRTSPSPFGIMDMHAPIEAARPLCMYPLVARYKGSASPHRPHHAFDPNEASSFVCSKNF